MEVIIAIAVKLGDFTAVALQGTNIYPTWGKGTSS